MDILDSFFRAAKAKSPSHEEAPLWSQRSHSEVMREIGELDQRRVRESIFDRSAFSFALVTAVSVVVISIIQPYRSLNDAFQTVSARSFDVSYSYLILRQW